MEVSSGGLAMTQRFRLGLAIAAAAIAAGALIPTASAQYDPTPRIDVRQEQSQAFTPRVTLPRGVVEAASVYESYLRHAAAIQTGFRDGESVRAAMNVGEAYQPEQMQEGLIAYAALIALEDERFVKGVQVVIRGPEAADREASLLLSNPAQVAAIPGAGHAAALIGAELRQEGGQLLQTGLAVKQAAYTVQREAWSKRIVPDQRDRLAYAKSLAATATIPAPDDVSHLLQTAAGFRDRATAVEQDPGLASPAIQRGLSLAALALMGEARDEGQLRPILADGAGASCMRMAKLNLYQCLAVAGPHYEDVFCLGQHALADTGQCVAAIGGSRGQTVAEMAAADR